MDGEEEVLIGGGADDIGGQEKWEGEEGAVTQTDCTCHLQRYHSQNDVFGQWLGSAELGDLGKKQSQLQGLGNGRLPGGKKGKGV